MRAFRQCGMRQARAPCGADAATDRTTPSSSRPSSGEKPPAARGARTSVCHFWGEKRHLRPAAAAYCSPPVRPTRATSLATRSRDAVHTVSVAPRFVPRRPWQSAARPSGPGRAVGLGPRRVRRHHDGDRRKPSGRMDDDRHGSRRAAFRPRIQHRRLCLLRACGMRTRLFQDGPRERGPNDRGLLARDPALRRLEIARVDPLAPVMAVHPRWRVDLACRGLVAAAPRCVHVRSGARRVSARLWRHTR